MSTSESGTVALDAGEVEFVGGLFPRNQLAGPGGGQQTGFDLAWLRDLARAHEHAGFDRVLIANGIDAQWIAAYAAAQTERLGFMIAHRPALQAPTLAARSFATLDHVTGGRIRLHAITGITAEPQYGDYLVDKDARYARTGEYLDIVRRTWTSDQPFDYEGKYFTIKGGFSPIKPLQAPHIPISFGGSSDAAYHIAVRHADLYAFWGEPLVDAKEQVAKLHAAAAAAGVASPRISLSVRLIVGPTEEIAWQRAHDIVGALKKNYQAVPGRVQGTGTQRLLAAAERGERHDRALWMPTASAVGGTHDSTALVGTPDTVVQALLDYHDIGVTTFLNRGYDPLHDTLDYGRWIIPVVREEARRRAQQKAEQARRSAA